MGQPCIFLGHESLFGTHYIRLVPLYDTLPMPQSDQRTVEDQGGAGYDKRNSDIRDASEDDQPCADNVGTAHEKQSAGSFCESVDDQQCADNRRKADANEQSTYGLCHVVDDHRLHIAAVQQATIDQKIVAVLQTTIGQKIVAEPQTTTSNL